MEMHQIRYFLAVAETLNFTRAAEECHVAQPSLSRAIRKLEEELGGDLFRRERNRTHLTDLGRAMQPLLHQAFESAAAAATVEPPAFLEVLERDGDRWSAELDGAAGELRHWLAAQPIRDFTVGPPDLETIFHAYYRREGSV